MIGRVFHIQRFSVQDGPGIRTVIFLQGCPLRCQWCHNPEGFTPYTKILFDPQHCIACFRCVKACPNQCHKRLEGLHAYDRTNCTACTACTEVCPSRALSKTGQGMTSEDVLKEALRDRAYFLRRGGGITLSGGEPLMQAAFAGELLRGAHQNGVTTCVETCGYVPAGQFEELLTHIDILYFDYKATGEDHLSLTGVRQDLILHNLNTADLYHKRIVLRCPMVPHRNMNTDHYRGIAETANRFSAVEAIHLEPYHSLGEAKARQMSVIPAYSGVSPEKQAMEEAKDLIMTFLRRNIPVIIQ